MCRGSTILCYDDKRKQLTPPPIVAQPEYYIMMLSHDRPPDP